ncbi:MAG: hypothetical protein JO249_12475 [Acidobacteria bacterium]|nr:hypothetical protein [Acidobacteriota bacterium]
MKSVISAIALAGALLYTSVCIAQNACTAAPAANCPGGLIGGPPMSDQAAAAAVVPTPRSSVELGPNGAANEAANSYYYRISQTDPASYAAQLAAWHAAYPANSVWQRVDGACNLGANPTTAEVLQWAGNKWGISPQLMYAEATVEGDWNMLAVGDAGGSHGLLQVNDRVANRPGGQNHAAPGFNGAGANLAQENSCFNADVYGARAYASYQQSHNEAGAIQQWFNLQNSPGPYSQKVCSTLQSQGWDKFFSRAVPSSGCTVSTTATNPTFGNPGPGGLVAAGGPPLTIPGDPGLADGFGLGGGGQGIIVYDPTAEDTRLQQLAIEQQNTTGGNAGVWQPNQQFLEQLGALITQQTGLSYSNAQLAQIFQQLYPGYNSQQAAPTPQQSVQTNLNTLSGTLEDAQAQARSWEGEQTTLGQLEADNAAAIGNLQVSQTGNEIALMSVQQQQTIRQLIMALLNAYTVNSAAAVNAQTASQLSAMAIIGAPAQIVSQIPMGAAAPPPD